MYKDKQSSNIKLYQAFLFKNLRSLALKKKNGVQFFRETFAENHFLFILSTLYL